MDFPWHLVHLSFMTLVPRVIIACLRGRPLPVSYGLRLFLCLFVFMPSTYYSSWRKIGVQYILDWGVMNKCMNPFKIGWI